MALVWEQGLTNRSLKAQVGLGFWIVLFKKDSGEWEVKANGARLIKTFPDLEEAKKAGLGLVARLAREALRELEILADETETAQDSTGAEGGNDAKENRG